MCAWIWVSYGSESSCNSRIRYDGENVNCWQSCAEKTATHLKLGVVRLESGLDWGWWGWVVTKSLAGQQYLQVRALPAQQRWARIQKFAELTALAWERQAGSGVLLKSNFKQALSSTGPPLGDALAWRKELIEQVGGEVAAGQIGAFQVSPTWPDD